MTIHYRDYDEEITYEVDREMLIDALVELAFDDYFPNSEESTKEDLKDFISSFNMEDSMAEYYYYDLKEFFKDDARALYKEWGKK